MALKKISVIMLLCFYFCISYCQPLARFADSIRLAYHIPELCYAVVSSDSVIDLRLIGLRKSGTALTATPNDRFRIGSNTKGITSFIAAQLVKKGQINWDTKFFDLFPELKLCSDKVFYNITLLDLLTMRAPFFPYTYTDSKPSFRDIQSNKPTDEGAARLNFVKWFLHHQVNKERQELYYSNVSYSAACLMLERATAKNYETLVQELGSELNISFGFGAPNIADSSQTWGHSIGNIPEQPGDNYKLNWLLAAGNLNVTLNDYTKFIQLQLRGLHGKSLLLSETDFSLLHYGKPIFALGWFCDTTERGHRISQNHGNPGTFLTNVLIVKEIDRAYIVFTNAQNQETRNGIDVLLEEMKRRYGY